MSSPKSLLTMQEQVRDADEAELLTLLTRVQGWPPRANFPTDYVRPGQCQAAIDAILEVDTEANHLGAVERARKFLFRLAEAAAERGGY